ncbi:DsbA family protein [Haladaptatus salinisoli]|uniref:DsbA family protein n=1 Tax=Haladaptatus salinisoli TaxID=2884876 RepID=UPI001D09D4F7|nr:thioredoxin domain-containing protein [Haladaptatus salinisoli]
MQLSGGAAFFGFAGAASANRTTSDPVSGAPVPDDPGQYTYATMGEGSNPTATLYGNFKCPYTKDFVLNNLEDVIREFVEPGRLDIRYRALAYEPPGESSHGSSYYYISSSDPRISECAMGAWNAEPNEYWAFFRDMFENRVSGDVTYDDMRARMRQSDLEERDTAISRAKDGRYEDPVYQTRYAAGDHGVEFTPTFELNGETTPPHHDTQDILNWIENRLPGAGTSSAPVGESGSATVGQGGDDWSRVGLSGSYDSPTAIATSLSYNGNHPTHVRLRNVGSDRFDAALEEWDYKDGWHTQETFGYAVLESGTHSLDGVSAEAGRVTTDHTFRSLEFGANFSATPVVFSQPQSYRGSHAVVTRHRNVSTSGMSVRLQEQESYGAHTTESVGYLAVEEGRGTLGGAAFEAGRTPESVTHGWHRISFDGSYSNPRFVADVQTYKGWNTSAVRYRNLSSSGVEVRIEEERSDDDEVTHRGESVGYLVFDGA